MALSILMVRALVEGVESAGVPRESFLTAAKLDPSRLGDGAERVSLGEYDRLVELALEMTGDPALGLRLGEEATTATYSLAAHLVAHAETLRAAIQSMVRYHRLLTDRPVHRLEETEDTATVVYEASAGPLVCRRFRAETTMVGLFRLVSFFGRGAAPHSVWFEHPEPRHSAEYTRIFGGVERFGQASNCIFFDRDLLDEKQLHTDAEFYSALETQARHRIARLAGSGPYKDRVFDCLLERATIGGVDMNTTARELGLSVRSLRRRLAEEGVSYNDLAREALAARARQLVSEAHRTIDEAAYMLGFSDRSAFHRAFKRWTGTTPKEYRRHQLQQERS